MASGISSGQKPTGVTDLDSVQTLENKTLDSSNAINGSTITSADIVSPNRADVKKGLLADLQTYAATGDGGNAVPNGQLCFATDEKEMYQVVDGLLEPVGGGASGTSIEISQTTHGFAVGDGIYHNGTSWVKGQANDGGTLATFAVTQVPDADNFVAYQFGRVTATGHGFTIGEYYFLSTTVAGQPTSTEPTSDFSNPLFYVEDANTLQVLVYRPSVVGNQTSIDELSDVSVPAPSDNEVLTYVAANSRFESQSVNSANVTYDNAGSTLAATDVDAAIDEVDGKVELKANADGATITNASIQSPSRLDVRKATQSELETYAGTADNGQLVFATDEKKMYQVIDNELKNVGGTAGIGGNLMVDFEDLTPTTSNVTSAEELVTFLPIDDNNKSIKATWAGSVGSIQYDVPLDAALQEIQGTVTVWLKTSLSDIQLSSVQDSVKISTVNVVGNNKWRQYEIPMVLGGSNVGFIVESLTAQTGDVFIDQPFVGLAPTSFSYDVAQSEHAFDVNIGGTNMILGAAQSSYVPFGDAGLDMVVNSGSNLEIPCSAPNLSSGLTCSSGSENVGVVFDAKVGTYEICAYFSGYTGPSTSASFTTFQLVETANDSATILQEGNTRSEIGGSNTVSNDNSQHIANCGTFQFNTAGRKTIRLMYEKVGTGNITVLANRNASLGQTDIAIKGKYYPPQSTIVTQVQTLDASTANQWNASFDSTHNLVSEDFEGVINCVNNGTGDVLCTWPTQTLTEAPTIDCTSFNDPLISDSITCTVREVSTTQARLRLYDANSNGFRDVGYKITVNKSKADYNKSAMIVGNFEQIKTTELCQVEAYGNSSDTISGGEVEDIPWETVRRETCVGSWNDSGNTGSLAKDTFTPVRSGYHMVSLSFRLTSSNNLEVYAYKDGVLLESLGVNTNNTISSVQVFNRMIYMEAGSNYTFRIATAGSYVLEQSSEDLFHVIKIKELGDTASLIKNLNDNKTVKCQTKYLSANFNTSGGVISDLGFSGLTIGKRYRLKAHNRVAYNNNDTVTLRYDYPVSGTDILAVFNSSFNGQSPSTYSEIDFTAIETSIQAKGESINAGNAIMGGQPGGQVDDTRATLCELPDYYIETDEW